MRSLARRNKMAHPEQRPKKTLVSAPPLLQVIADNVTRNEQDLDA